MQAYISTSFLLMAVALGGNVLPGIPWYDTAGNSLQAHGAGMTKVGDTYYLIGENKTQREGNSGGNYFNSVACYRSTDLLAWEFVNNILSYDPSIPDLADERIVERPKVVFNQNTNQYVMWMHIDSSDYGDARAGVATSDSVCGDYSYIGSERPKDNLSRDMTLFVDEDGAGYLISEDRDEGTHFYRLSDDYLTVEEVVYTLSFDFMDALEAPAVVRVDGLYYFFGSRLTGWSPNDNEYTTATSLTGPWAESAKFAPDGSSTCTSQATYVLQGPNGKFMYMGDRWESDTLWDSRYIWLPLNINSDDRTASTQCIDSWDTSDIGVES